MSRENDCTRHLPTCLQKHPGLNIFVQNTLNWIFLHKNPDFCTEIKISSNGPCWLTRNINLWFCQTIHLLVRFPYFCYDFERCCHCSEHSVAETLSGNLFLLHHDMATIPNSDITTLSLSSPSLTLSYLYNWSLNIFHPTTFLNLVLIILFMMFFIIIIIIIIIIVIIIIIIFNNIHLSFSELQSKHNSPNGISQPCADDRAGLVPQQHQVSKCQVWI